MNRNIAIDGPAGAGKSTIAKRVAAARNAVYVDTGAMYRAIGLYMTDHQVPETDIAAVEAALPGIDLTLRYDDGVQQVILNGENVSEKIRTPEVSAAASKYSAIGAVRRKLVSLQQELARKVTVVMDGRDIASKVLPDALVKIYLTASVAVRAKRRYDENAAKGMIEDLAEIEAQIAERDKRDMEREESPLVKVPEAIEVDSSDMTIDQVVARILAIAAEKEEKA